MTQTLRKFLAELTGKTVKERLEALRAKRDELVEQRKTLLAEQRSAWDEASKRDGGASDEDKKAFDAHETRAKEIANDLDHIDREARMAGLEGQDPPEIRDTTQGAPPENVTRVNETILPANVRNRSIPTNRNGNPIFESREQAYRSGQWLLGWLGNERSRQWATDHGMEFRTQNEGNNFNGGILAPEEFMASLVKLLEEYGVFRREMSPVTPMMSDTLIFPIYAAGVTASWVAEEAAATASDIDFGFGELITKKLKALTLVSSEIDEDAVMDIGGMVADDMAYRFSLAEDNAGFIGDGTSTYGGIFGLFPKIDDGNHAGSIYTAATGNTAFSTLDLVDFEGALGQLPQYAVAGAKWYISRVGFYASMARLIDAAGGNTRDHLSGGANLQFLGLPVVISQVCNSTTAAQTSTVICAVGNLRMAAKMGQRRQFRLATSNDRYFDTDQIGIKATSRIAINFHSLGDGSTAGPVIGLKTPSS